MNWTSIKKNRQVSNLPPNLSDYDRARARFSWDAVRQELEGLPGGGLNIAREAVDRHAAGHRREHVAIRWLGQTGDARDITYAELSNLTNRFANVLRQLGVCKGDRVFALAGRIPELYVAALGSLKAGCVFCPLFSAFGPEPVFQRLSRGNAKVLVTTPQLYKQKVAQLRDRLPELKHVLLAGVAEGAADVSSLAELMAAASAESVPMDTQPEDMALLHFTSGTTGMPKGAVHVHNAVLMHYMTGKTVLDFHPDDIFWCTADPGWVTGTSYGTFGRAPDHS